MEVDLLASANGLRRARVCCLVRIREVCNRSFHNTHAFRAEQGLLCIRTWHHKRGRWWDTHARMARMRGPTRDMCATTSRNTAASRLCWSDSHTEQA